MKSKLEKEIDKYFKEVKSYIFCDSKTRSELIKDIESSVYDYAEREGIKDISEIYDKFGSPEELAEAYLAQIDPEKVRKASALRKIIIICIIIFLIVFTLYLIHLLIDLYDSTHGYFEIEMLEPTCFTIPD